MSDLALNCEASEKLITHSKSTIPSLDLSNISETLRQKRNLSLPLEGALQLLEQLAQFELGRFLLINKGLNGHWTSVIPSFREIILNENNALLKLPSQDSRFKNHSILSS